ncbi:metallopeptidase TldD-related protein [Acidobacteria bacterium AH-259-A15]|nr:metallopeptidase TldD-related protein [Acidobacteria bacterium AH-259-A15]
MVFENSLRKTLVFGALFTSLLVWPLYAQEDVVMRAMQDELARSIEKLQLEELEKPYFISYRVRDTKSAGASGTLGSLLSSEERKARQLVVEVRVGEYTLDNTNFLSLSMGRSGLARMFGGRISLPVEDDYKEIRRHIWLATDAAYKMALEDLSKKRAALQNKTRTDEVPDFSKEQPTEIIDRRQSAGIDLAAAEELVRDISVLFKEMPHIFTSKVEFEVTNFHTRYVNSEGTSFERNRSYTSFTVRAGTQAEDGMPLEDFIALFGRSRHDLPEKQELVNRVREMGRRLATLRKAPLVDLYNGPALFEGQAAAELFAQGFAPRLLAIRRPITDDPRYQRFAEQAQNPFQDRLGARVLPRFLHVIDDPTLTEYEDHALVGGYGIDDDGVAAGETRVVQRGILKTLLSTRSPVPGVMQSTGNRRGSGPFPSNLIVRSTRKLNGEELKQELLTLMHDLEKEYGIIVRRIGNRSFQALQDGSRRFFMPSGSETTQIQGMNLAFKVYPDGREELIRNLQLSNFSVRAFKDIVATSDTYTVHSVPFSPPFRLPTAPATVAIVSFVVPSLLFEEVTLKKPTGEIQTLPILDSPLPRK